MNAEEKAADNRADSYYSEEPGIKRNIRDSVFTHLFRDKRYLLQLYQALHPEDTSATEEDLVSITIDNVFVDGQYNDLGFLVGDRLMIPAEAQSTWSVNIVIRGLFYLVNSLQEYCRRHDCDLYRSRKIELPKMELYAVYSTDECDKQKISVCAILKPQTGIFYASG